MSKWNIISFKKIKKELNARIDELKIRWINCSQETNYEDGYGEIKIYK